MAEMKQTILEKLQAIENENDVRILFACESGSRAWGFESPDSDYDVRFIYVRPKKEYLLLEDTRDVLEFPINDMLDVNGWDLDKTLKLLHSSNPALYEWLASPVVYKTTPIADNIRALISKNYSYKKMLYHYLHMAKGNFRTYLKEDMVVAKKYLYVIRPLLAARWIIEKGSLPPMPFTELVREVLPEKLLPDINAILEIKMAHKEAYRIPRNEDLNSFVENSITEVEKHIGLMPKDTNMSWEELNDLFQNVLNEGDNIA